MISCKIYKIIKLLNKIRSSQLELISACEKEIPKQKLMMVNYIKTHKLIEFTIFCLGVKNTHFFHNINYFNFFLHFSQRFYTSRSTNLLINIMLIYKLSSQLTSWVIFFYYVLFCLEFIICRRCHFHKRLYLINNNIKRATSI